MSYYLNRILKTLKLYPLPINYSYIYYQPHNEVTSLLELDAYDKLLLLLHSPDGAFE